MKNCGLKIKSLVDCLAVFSLVLLKNYETIKT